MKLLFLSIFIVLVLSISVYADELVENIEWADGRIAKNYYSDFSLKTKGDKIILTTQDGEYVYPTDKDEYIGIKEVSHEDINNDGKAEYILAVQLKGSRMVYSDGTSAESPECPYAVVLIAEQRGNKLDIQKEMVLGNDFPSFELVDINKDGIKDVIASGWELMNWSYLKIASWQNGKYILLWDRGADCSIVSQSFEINKNGDAQINVGFPRYIESKGRFDEWYNAQEWETWIWNGKKFINK